MPNIIDTITAPATPPGRGGIGVIRVSGPKTKDIAQAVLGQVPTARSAIHLPFNDQNGETIDLGIAIFFPNPKSFTGEDVLELHGHGGPVVMDLLLQRILSLGARMARPGEFSERAFLNNKLDLAQAEAIADLIDSSSTQAARFAVRSLQGEFSKRIHVLLDALIHLRMYVEAAIDFPEEEIDFLSDEKLNKHFDETQGQLENVLMSAQQGALLREGIAIVIAGPPNAGKSSLLNQLSGKDAAIVTDIPGTTRDTIKEFIHIDGIPLHIIDTAGLRNSPDVVEKEGIRRAQEEMSRADQILLVVDSSKTEKIKPEEIWPEIKELMSDQQNITVICNKIDLTKQKPKIEQDKEFTKVYLSAKTGEGIEELKQHIKKTMGANDSTEGGFIARRRHIDALQRAEEHMQHAKIQLQQNRAGELVAEELRLAQNALSEITGAFSSDDLLGEIFSSFCIGK